MNPTIWALPCSQLTVSSDSHPGMTRFTRL
jgi:hypothetical protein